MRCPLYCLVLPISYVLAYFAVHGSRFAVCGIIMIITGGLSLKGTSIVS